ncbi:PREDICTED: uncharacterized protein LOC108376421 [Rhagoletis zephyria]|uniref:uncharacterized protein LOC108376421 n=1 Tax=Rhagoletis zephyria TaxID=28612 RepID=UPI00081189E5|nr:PREDICTED: uncharacterized protein LOC108376421 [Rhagoletis zephyria]
MTFNTRQALCSPVTCNACQYYSSSTSPTALHNRNYAITLDSVNYTIHQQGWLNVEQFYCGSNSIGLSTFTLHLRVQKNITEFQIRDNFFILRKGNTIQNTEVINACDMLNGNYGNAMIKLSILELHQVTRPVFLCPLIENTLYIITNYTLRPSVYPPYLPLMSYVEIVEFSMGGVHYLDLIFKGRVKKA